MGEILLICLIITLSKFSFACMENEVDSFPAALQFYNHNWLPNDWYLNLDPGYRQVFNTIFGPLISRLGFMAGVYAGRIILYLLTAIAIYFFFRTVGLVSCAPISYNRASKK